MQHLLASVPLWLQALMAAACGPLGLLLGHRLKRRWWFRRWFLILLAAPPFGYAFVGVGHSLLPWIIGFFLLCFYMGQWDVSRENPLLRGLLGGRRILLWQLFRGVLLAGFAILVPCQVVFWAVWLSDRSTIPFPKSWLLHLATGLALFGLAFYKHAEVGWQRRIGVSDLPETPEHPHR